MFVLLRVVCSVSFSSGKENYAGRSREMTVPIVVRSTVPSLQGDSVCPVTSRLNLDSPLFKY